MSTPAAQLANSQRPPLPPTLPGMATVRRYWDTQRGRYIAKVSPGECFVTGTGELIATVLGSCVSACVRDRTRRLAGMNHFMLPMEGRAERNKTSVDAALRYGNFAMEHLFNEFISRGSRRVDLEVKVFGGGNVMDSSVRVGDRNIKFVKEYLSTEQYFIESKDLGGDYGRKVLYDSDTGRVLIKVIRTRDEELLAERRYVESLKEQPSDGGIELF